MPKYPIGLQNFRKVREGGFLYVDKTPLIHQLIESGSYYFLSRPRRFGKSLLLSTMKEIFKGSKELFKGLWMEDHWDWEKKYPVIHLKLSQINYQDRGLYYALNKELDIIAQEYEIALEETDLKDKFRELIRKAYIKGNEKVAILIDEYDKPIVDYLDDIAKAEENRAIFKNFYSVLKDADEYIRLLLITGVSRFSKVSIFSDLNNLRDITLAPPFATITGITQEELERNFAGEISELQAENPAILQEIKEWYNGYSWNKGNDTVYNPFSLLNFMADKDFRNYWYQTGTPTFLVNHMRQNRESLSEQEMFMGENTLGNFNIEQISSVPLLFQTGYLTVKSYDAQSQTYQLGYPNKEVEDSLVDALLSAYRNVFPGNDSFVVRNDLRVALIRRDIPGIIKSLDAIIGSIPPKLWKANAESEFHIITYMAFRSVGVDVRSEVHSSRGICDVLVLTKKYIYALELKLNATPKKALKQLLDKGYLRPYQMDTRPQLAIGINFSSTKREITGYEMTELKHKISS